MIKPREEKSGSIDLNTCVLAHMDNFASQVNTEIGVNGKFLLT